MQGLLFGTHAQEEALRDSLSRSAGCYRSLSLTRYGHYDDFLRGLREQEPEVILVTMDGAEGMEAVIAARCLKTAVPVCWFSEDGGFRAQAYRLGCTFFCERPVPPETLAEMLNELV